VQYQAITYDCPSLSPTTPCPPPPSDSLQWSKGEYLDANSNEDDIMVMTMNGMPLRPDDHGDSLEGATLVTDGVTVPDTTTTLRAGGVIHTETDVDWLSFHALATAVTITVAGAGRDSNLDAVLALIDDSGNELTSDNPEGELGVTLTYTLPADGTYFVTVQGTGKGDLLDTGYSAYGSLGNYAVSITAAAGAVGMAPVAVASASTSSGAAPLSVQFSAAESSDPDGTIVSYAWTFGDGGKGTGVAATRVYTTGGTFVAFVVVTDSAGLQTTSNSLQVVVTVPPMQLTGFTVTVAAKGSGTNRAATGTATLTVMGGNRNPVAGAVVTGSWTGAVTSSPLSATTNARGVATIKSASTKTTGTLTFTVSSITRSDLVHNPALDLVYNSKSATWS
jgi:PKD repeat protein